MTAGATRREPAQDAGTKTAGAMPRELAVQIAVGAFMTALTWWLDNGAKLPPYQIDAMFRRLAMEGLLREQPAVAFSHAACCGFRRRRAIES